MNARLFNRLRAGIDGLCHWPLVRLAGTDCYWWAASAVARKLYRFPGVRSVALRGGMVRGCRPGISDLDFTVLLHDESFETEVTQSRALIAEYRSLKRFVPMLGELTLTTTGRWSHFERLAPGPVLGYRDQLRFHNGRWTKARCEAVPHAAARFALALDHFRLALHAAQLDDSRYGRIVAAKEMRKAGKFAGDETAGEDPILVFLALDRLATEAVQDRFFTPELTWPEAPVLRRAAHAVLGDWQIATLLKRPGFSEGVAAGDAPFSLAASPHHVRTWMPALLRREKGESRLPVYPLSPAMSECRARGWAGWWPTEPLAQFPNSGAPSPERGGHLLRSLVERLCHDSICLVPGRLTLAADRESDLWETRFSVETNALRQALRLDPVAKQSQDRLSHGITLARSAMEAVALARDRSWLN